MAKTPTSPTTNTEWRSGRPSFKAFYPEIFLLTLITIAFIALGAKLSCSAIKSAKTGSAPAEVTELSLFCAPVYGQEPALGGTESGETELVIDAAPEESTTAPEPVAQEDAVATEAPATPEPGPAATEASVAIAPEQAAPEATAESKSLAPNAEQTTSGAAPAQESPAAKGKIPWNKILWIWVCCLIVRFARSMGWSTSCGSTKRILARRLSSLSAASSIRRRIQCISARLRTSRVFSRSGRSTSRAESARSGFTRAIRRTTRLK